MRELDATIPTDQIDISNNVISLVIEDFPGRLSLGEYLRGRQVAILYGVVLCAQCLDHLMTGKRNLYPESSSLMLKWKRMVERFPHRSRKSDPRSAESLTRKYRLNPCPGVYYCTWILISKYYSCIFTMTSELEELQRVMNYGTPYASPCQYAV